MSIERLTFATAHYPPVIRDGLRGLALNPIKGFSEISFSEEHKHLRVNTENQVERLQTKDIPDSEIIVVQCMLTPCLFIMAEVRDEARQVVSLNIGHYTAQLNPEALFSLLSPLAQDFQLTGGMHSHLWIAGMSQRKTHQSLFHDVRILQNVLQDLNLPFYATWDKGNRPVFHQTTGDRRIISDIGLDLISDLPDYTHPALERWMMGLVGASITALASIQKVAKMPRQTTFFLPDSDPVVVRHATE